MGLYLGNENIHGVKMTINVIGDDAGSSGGSSTQPEENWIGDGNTHIWIHLEEGRTSPVLGVCPKGTVTVDWGDGTTPDTLTGTSTSSLKWTPRHSYAKAGDYVVTLTVDGEMGISGVTGSASGSAILNHSSSSDSRNHMYRTCIKKVEIGTCVTSIGDYAFYNCQGLISIRITDGVTSIGDYAFSACPNLQSITIPYGVTSVGKYTFFNNYGLARVSIPESVASIGTNSFTGCHGLAKLRFDGATPPTISSSSDLSYLMPDCIISVPVGSLAAYTSATNYPSASKYTYIEED